MWGKHGNLQRLGSWALGARRLEGARAGAAVLSTRRVLISLEGSVETASRTPLSRAIYWTRREHKKPSPEKSSRARRGKQELVMSALPFSMITPLQTPQVTEGPLESQTLGCT